MPYHFDPNIYVSESEAEPERKSFHNAFEYEPIPEVNLTDCLPLPEDWLKKLADIIELEEIEATNYGKIIVAKN